MIAVLGNLSRDFLPGVPPRTGGGPFHAARALQHLDTPAIIHPRCAPSDRAELLPPLVALGSQVRFVPGEATAGFEMSYVGDRREMTVRALGDTWAPSDLPALPEEARWVHLAPLARSDFPAETLAAAATRGRRLSLDGQGLVRPSRTGPLVLDGEFDPEVLRHVWVLKLNDEEAEAVGDPARLGVRELLLTHGARGATVVTDGRVHEVPAFPLDGDPTGAGDGFCVSYLAGRSAGLAPPAAARRATAVVAAMMADAP
ncbi:MAG TPA: PfkB family carbohydrate kinase [Gaiellaceae bacterium]|nr:PfkB family carbohydrate kinase [Gaiellaceae bacterium]